MKRLTSFGEDTVGSDDARTAIISYRLGDLEALLKSAAEFIISIDPNHKDRIFDQLSIYRESENLFKSESEQFKIVNSTDRDNHLP